MKFVLSVLLLSLLIPGAHAQDRPSKPSERCTITGTVVKSTTGEPLKKATVVLLQMEGRRDQPRGATSDANGHFEMTGIDPGKYLLYADRTGYVRQEYGQRGASPRGATLTLAPGQHLKDVTFRLLPGAVITGKVSDEDGEPLAGVNVRALRRGYADGKRQLMYVGGAQSNDLGDYRMYGLPPGQYYMSASPPQHSGVAANEEGYAATYYPGTTDSSAAATVTVRAGDELPGVDFSLMTTPTVRVRGRVVGGTTGRGGREVMITLQPRDPSMRYDVSNRGTVNDSEGGFEIRGVRPGSYTLLAFRGDRGSLYTAREPIEVGNTDLEGLTITLTPPIILSGKIRSDGKAQLSISDLQISLLPLAENLYGGGGTSSVRDDGTFTVQNVSDGLYRVRVSGTEEKWYVKSVRAGGDDALENGLTVARGQSPGQLEIVLSPGAGRIDGKVADENQKPIGGSQVVLVPDPRHRNREDLYKTATTDQDGRFSLDGLAPGDYRLFAWEEVESGAYRDPEFVREYEERGQKVRVDEGTSLSVQLKVIPRSDAAQ